jgi:hypothetical protein
MKRSILAFLAGLITWAVVATLLNFALRASLDSYHAAERSLITAHVMAFTLPMMLGRLTLAALADLAAGWVVGRLAPAGLRVAAVLGTLILLLFLPSHVQLFSLFPLWYHLSFLVPLVPLVMLGARLARGGPGTAALARAA